MPAFSAARTSFTRYGNILCGLDPAYKAVPKWTGEVLAEFIVSHGYARSEEAGKSEPQRVMKIYFLYLAAEYCRTMKDRAYQAYINKTLTRMVNDLSGVIARA